MPTSPGPTLRADRVRQVLATMLIAAFALVGSATTASADRGNVTEVPYEYGLFYSTFDESPNTFLLAGGTAEEFCESDPETGPGMTTARITERSDGSTLVRVDDRGQAIHLYTADADDAFEWLDRVCAEFFAGIAAPQPFASGTAKLRIRDRIHPDGRVEVFNGVLGRATAADGTRYVVAGWADFEVVDGAPIGDPADFVGFRIRQIGHDPLHERSAP